MNTKNILYPVSIYWYNRQQKPDGEESTIMNYQRHEGKRQPDLESLRKSKPGIILYLTKPELEPRPGKPKRILQWAGGKRTIKPKGKETKTDRVSGIFEPDINRPGHGYGDINNGRDSILLKWSDTEVMIMVFELDCNPDYLFTLWGSGGVKETVLSNNVTFPTVSVQDIVNSSD